MSSDRSIDQSSNQESKYQTVQTNYTSRDPKQLRTDGQAQTCQQLVAFCASTRMNQNDAVVNLARVALLHVCCWRASRFSTAPELRLRKRARSHGQCRHTCPIQTHITHTRARAHLITKMCFWNTRTHIHSMLPVARSKARALKATNAHSCPRSTPQKNPSTQEAVPGIK